ncbi:M42 family metallopeptidase [Rubritalea tangerina]|uniref:M42 family metallopeptidase n=1 Tax=Rubritalea tangerina TaxID=430798 RepID=A0ABW4ZEB3_9BACT
MAIDVDLLARVCKAPGAPGYEIEIRELVLKELEGLVDDVRIDSMGNVVALKKGKDSSKKVMAAAHMDEIGFIVTHIDDQGFVRFAPLGGFDPKTLTAQRVLIHGKKDVLGVMGCKPIHIMTPEERGAKLSLDDYFIDTGLTKKQLEKIIQPGSPITRERELVEMGDTVNVKSLDNRASVFVLLEALRKLKSTRRKPAYDFYAVFTVQEEIGIRGANVSTLEVQPDFGIGLDITLACDTPGVPDHKKITRLGEGAAIKVMDSSCVCDYRMVEFMKKTATAKKIKWQTEILPAGGTDTAGLQRMTPGGSIAGAISIPTRYVHQVIEMAHKKDLDDCIKLLAACVCDLDKYDWSF